MALSKSGRFILYERNRFKGWGYSDKKIKKLLYLCGNYTENIDFYELDHIIPYAICADSSIENLQLLSHKDHSIKTGNDRRIMNIMKKEGYFEHNFFGQNELKKPISELKNRYLELLNT